MKPQVSRNTGNASISDVASLYGNSGVYGVTVNTVIAGNTGIYGITRNYCINFSEYP
jgi:hypothetical protein